MDSPPKLSGETLIVHHIPLVHCQVSGSRQGGCGGSLKRNNAFSPPENLGLSRTTSLPERDILHGEALLYSSLIQTSSGAWASHQRADMKGGRGGSTASEDSSFTSSNSEEQITAHTLPRAKSRLRPAPRHNPFLLKTDGEEEEEEDDELSRYHEDSFHLHGDFHSYTSEPFHLHSSADPPLSHLCEHLEDLEQGRHYSSGSNMSMDCGEQDWPNDEEDEDHIMSGSHHCSCCTLSHGYTQPYSDTYPEPYPEPFSETFSEGQAYGSDSSCNSSEGVLVNFSSIYSKLNNAVPEQPPSLGDSNQNSLADPLCRCDPPGDSGAFYLDLHTSPTEPPRTHPFPLLREPLLSTSSTCSAEHQALDLDANCNLCPPQDPGELAPCLQSQARLVVATQNYYKLVTCDLSSQSSPSPAGSSVNSSDEQSRGSPTPPQPSHYFLFRQQHEPRLEEEEPSSHRADEEEEDEEEEEKDQDSAGAVLEGQVYVNLSPPVRARGAIGEGSSGGRPRSRSYDRSLDVSECGGLGSVERMLSCPVRLCEGTAPVQPTPPRVTSFAEIARSKRRAGPVLHSPKTTAEHTSFSTHSSTEFSPIPEQTVGVESHREHRAFKRSHSQGPMEPTLEGAWSQGAVSSPSQCPAVVRYSKDQRPTTLPIQPFTFQHQFASRPAQPKPLLPLLTGYMSGAHSSSNSGGDKEEETLEEIELRHQGEVAPPAGSVRPSPLGSYSPVQFRGASSSGTCSTCSPSPQPAHSRSCPLSAGTAPQQSPLTLKHNCGTAPLPPTPPPASLGAKRGVVPPALPMVQGHLFQRDSLSPLGCVESKHTEGHRGTPVRTNNAHHLSPQALKWKEYRRRNPLGLERAPGGPTQRSIRRNVFDFPPEQSGPPAGRLNGRPKLQQTSIDLAPDYFSLTERPPEEFCLSPDASTTSSQTHASVDLSQKRGLVKAVNTAVDLIVAHFGTTRDPDVKSKLGNSWVSPNVGHLILKYLCPALHDVLQDGLKAYVLDLIIGQRRCGPWSLVEASTQPGPSTRVLHSLFSKVSQYSELTSHTMRLNAFIFGLLNLKSLEFWFNHLYTHEDIIGVHYNPWGFLPLSQGPCQPLFEELLLLLQPLSLLPFDLDLLFEPHLLQKGQEQQRRKELLCSARHSLHQSERSTFQLMRGWSSSASDCERDANMEPRTQRPALRREGTWHGTEVGRARGGESDSRGAESDRSRERAWTTGRAMALGQERTEEGKQDEANGASEGRQRQDRQSGWWYQLMQSSQVYIDQSTQGSKFIRTERRRRSSERQQAPPTREGVVEGAESCQQGEPGCSSSGGVSGVVRGRPSWMGSPPESVLNHNQERGSTVENQGPQTGPSQGQGLRWGRLFGSSINSLKEGTEVKKKAQKSRPPSGWLSLDSSVFGLVAQSLGGGSLRKEKEEPLTEEQAPAQSAQTTQHSSQREVRALCHHIATEPGQLSFNKGDLLRVLSRADPDWLLCSLGSERGLVPIVYVTLSGTEDTPDQGQDTSGLGLC